MCRLALPGLVACCLAGCSTKNGPDPDRGQPARPDITEYRTDGAGVRLAVHPAVNEQKSGAVEFYADGHLFANERQEARYYRPDQQVGGLRVESVEVEPTHATNHVRARFPAADRDKIRAFAAAHPETPFFGLRFESTPAGKASEGVTRNEVIFWIFRVKDIRDDGTLDLSQSTPEEGHALARRLVGK